MSSKPIDMQELREFLTSRCGPGTKIYLGCDSEKFKKKGVTYADYMLAVVVHINGKEGCKVFGEVQTEADYDKNKGKPRMRLMTEVYKVAELHSRLMTELEDIIENYDVALHIDINKDDRWGSSCVVNEAIGYIKAMCNVVPMCKPQSPAASFCADRLKGLDVVNH